MIKKTLDYLGLRHAGGVELYFSLLLILSTYSFMGIRMEVIAWLLLFFILFFKKKARAKRTFVPLIVLATYILVHDFLNLFIANGNINSFIMQIVYFVCMINAVKVFNLEKLKGSINLVAIIAMIGLLYQWGIIAAGGYVRPIQIPFLEMAQARLEVLSIRPSSFFMEPAAYVAFMYIPLAFSLIEKKYIWTALIILSEFLTTSSTGVLTSFIMLFVYVMTQRVSLKIRLLTIVIGAAMFISLFYVEAFQTSVNKLEETDVESTVRLSQGPYVVSTMKWNEYIFGASYSSAYEYCHSGRAPLVIYYGKEVFLSTFWKMILLYGITGLFFYLLFYCKIVRKNKESLPLVACLIATMFSSGYGIGMNFVYTSIMLMLIMYRRDLSATTIN